MHFFLVCLSIFYMKKGKEMPMTYQQSKEQDDLYRKGEALGRKDGAKQWGMADTRSMPEPEAMGYRDGYYSTTSL
jgi:hypothetical protein